MDTVLNNIESLLQSSEMGLTIQKITQLAGVTEKEAKATIKTLHSMGQIEMIPAPGRWGPRYAWLAAKPVMVEPPAIPETQLLAGNQEVITGDGDGKALPDAPVAPVAELTDETAEGKSEHSAQSEVTVKPGLATRYAVAVPRRPLRIVRTRVRAETLALAAVRRGAKGAEVFALTPVGRAKRDATFQDAGYGLDQRPIDATVKEQS